MLHLLSDYCTTPQSHQQIVQILFGMWGLGALLHLWYRNPESFPNIVLLGGISSVSVLFAIGGHVIRIQNWPTVKMVRGSSEAVAHTLYFSCRCCLFFCLQYAILLFLAAGTQLGFDVLFLLDFFPIDGTISDIVSVQACG